MLNGLCKAAWLLALGVLILNAACARQGESQLDKGRRLLLEAKACGSDEQCTVTTEFACPFGCCEAVNKHYDRTELNTLVHALRRDIVCERCVEEEVVAVCRRNLCETQVATSIGGAEE